MALVFKPKRLVGWYKGYKIIFSSENKTENFETYVKAYKEFVEKTKEVVNDKGA